MLSVPFALHPRNDVIPLFLSWSRSMSENGMWWGWGNPRCMDFYYFLFSFKKGPSTRPQKTNSCGRSGHLHGPWSSAYLPAWKGCQLTNPTAWTESWLRGVQHSSHTHIHLPNLHIPQELQVCYYFRVITPPVFDSGMMLLRQTSETRVYWGWLHLAWCQCWRACWQHSTHF